jgi:dipeptidase D
VLNLDSEDYDTITIGAAGANLQRARMAFKREEVPEGYVFRKLQITGGRGGHSGVNINKNRMNANKLLVKFLFNRYVINDIRLVSINGGDASASIASSATAVIGVKEKDLPILENRFQEFSEKNNKKFESSDPDIKFTLEPVEKPDSIIRLENGYNALIAIDLIPCGVLKMHEQLENTVMTSNNIGLVRTEDDALMLTLHTRSFSNEELEEWSKAFAIILESEGFEIERIMNAPSWQENPDSPFLKLVDQTFQDTLHFSPRKVAMHFVLEAGYYVQKYPGIQIACIGPRIVEPHSTQERVEMSTIENIWQVVVELLERVA